MEPIFYSNGNIRCQNEEGYVLLTWSGQVVLKTETHFEDWNEVVRSICSEEHILREEMKREVSRRVKATLLMQVNRLACVRTIIQEEIK